MRGGVIPGPGAPGDRSEPDVLGAAEFEDARMRTALERERLLMYAVLEDALACYRLYATSHLPRARQLHQEAREWVDSDDRSSLFAFESICDALDIDAELIRGRLRAFDAATGRPRGG